MRSGTLQAVLIRILAAILAAAVIFLLWVPRGDDSPPVDFETTEIAAQVSAVMGTQLARASGSQGGTPSLTPTETMTVETPALTTTPEATTTGTASPTLTPTPSDTPTTTPSLTWTPEDSPTATQTNSSTPTPTATPSPSHTTTPVPARLSGRLLLNGSPVAQDVVLVLEDQAYNLIAEAVVSPGGGYVFNDVPPSAEGYNILFTQTRNSSFSVFEVLSFAWFGPISLQEGTALDLPDFDIGLQGLDYTNPIPNSQVKLSTITDDSPLTFRWTGHPYAGQYQAALYEDENLSKIWESGPSSDPSADFFGNLDDGSRIETGQYWWRVSVEGTLGAFTVNGIGFLDGFRIIP